MSTELYDALLYLEKEKGIERNLIIEAIEAALVSAARDVGVVCPKSRKHSPFPYWETKKPGPFSNSSSSIRRGNG